jgi:hypothetical protein
MPIGIALGIALLTSPPIPPPTPEALAAAAELRRLAPLPEEWRRGFSRSAVNQFALDAVGAKGPQTRFEVVPPAEALVTARLAGRWPRIGERVASCVDLYLGYGFDLATLRDMARAVTTKGGHALWLGAIREPTQSCYFMTVYNELADFKPAIAWLAANDLIAKVPKYDPVKGDAGFARDLEALCGSGARGAVQSRSGKLGLAKQWVDREAGRTDSSIHSCLTYGALAAGHELLRFDE